MPFALGEKTLSEEMEKVMEYVKSLSWKQKFEDVIGDQRLAYKMKKYDRGFFVDFYCELSAQATIELAKTLRLEKNILRYLIIGVPESYELKKSEIQLPARRTRRKDEEAKEKVAVRAEPVIPVKKEESQEKPVKKTVEQKIEKPKEKLREKPAEKPSLASIEKKLQSIIDNPDIDL
ncbi:30S ribosomal protein S6 [Candidatus Peregrinibacteria bacterium]|nr:30S ribosomal protein S6 [Candidatus Peregrinibacteria bacterium]